MPQFKWQNTIILEERISLSHTLPLFFSPSVKSKKWHYSTYLEDSDDKSDYQTEWKKKTKFLLILNDSSQ